MNTFPFIHRHRTAVPLITALLFLITLTAFAQKPGLFTTVPKKPEIYVQTGHSSDVHAVVFSPDGKTIASGSNDNTIKLWDAESGQELKTFKGHSNTVFSVVFSPDGKTIVSGSNDDTIRLWDVASEKELKIFRGHSGPVCSVAFSPDGKVLASGGWDNVIRIWDVVSGQELKSLTGHSDRVLSVAFSRGGKTIASGSRDSTIKLWDLGSWQELKTLKGHSGPVDSIAFASNGTTLASGSQDKSIRIWEVSSGRELKVLKVHRDSVKSIAFSSDGGTMASAGDTVKLWNADSWEELKTLKGSDLVAFSPDGKTLAGGGDDHTIKLWDVVSGQETKVFKGHTSFVSSVVYSPDGKLLASGGYDHTIKIWDLASGHRLRTLSGHSGAIVSVAFSSDGKMLASSTSDGTVKLWNVASGRELKTLRGHEKGVGPIVGSVAFSPDKKTVASGNNENTVKLWDVSSGRELKTFNGHTSFVRTVVFSPDGKALASAAETIKLWDVATGKELKTFKGSDSVAFSSDGKMLAGGGGDNTIKLWSVESGLELKTLKGHSGDVLSIKFSPDNKTLVSGSYDQTVRLWSVTTGKELMILRGHSDWVESVAFSPDGKTLASGSLDSTVKLWEAYPLGVGGGNALVSLIALDEKDWIVVTPDGRFDGSPDGMKLISYKQGDRLLPLESFFEQFFTPDLLQHVYSGRGSVFVARYIGLPKVARRPVIAPVGTVDFSRPVRLPPVVRITSPQPGLGSASDTAQIVVEADDRGGGVEDIRLYQNGKLLDDVTRQLTRETKPNTRTFDVNLLPGVNTFRATAFNKDRTEATPDEIKIELKAAEATANLYILAIGLNEYKNTRYNLNYGNADAQAFADAVENRGKAIFKQISKKVMFDADASHVGIKTAFDDIIKDARPQDVFVFFYAGHGAMSERDGTTASDFYLVPYDVVSIFGDRGNLAAKGIAARDLREMLRKIKALKQLIVIDACQSGGAVETIAMRGPAEEKAIMQLARSAGVAVLASAGQEQVASEFTKLGHGVFTYALLKGLSGEADGAPLDGKVTVKELEAYLNDQVPELTKLHRGKLQYPNSSTRGQDFPIGIK